MDLDVERKRMLLMAEVQRMVNEQNLARQIVPSMLVGRSGPVGGGTVTRFPAKPQVQQQLDSQLPRLRELADSRFRVSPTPTLQPNLPEVMPLVRVKPEAPVIKEMLGHEVPRYAATARVVEKLEPLSTPWHSPEATLRSRENGRSSVGTTAAGFETQDAAMRAALIQAINRYSSTGSQFKPVKPQISEFASPESARKSWRVVDNPGLTPQQIFEQFKE